MTVKTDNSKVNYNLLKENKKLKERVKELEKQSKQMFNLINKTEMNEKKFIQEIISNELEFCFKDCSQDNINKWVEILNRYKKQLLLHSVSQHRELLIEAFDLINVHDGDREKITKLVDITLKSINCG